MGEIPQKETVNRKDTSDMVTFRLKRKDKKEPVVQCVENIQCT